MRSSKNIFEYSRGYKDGRAEQQAKYAALVEAVGNYLDAYGTGSEHDGKSREQRTAEKMRLRTLLLLAHRALTTEAPAADREGES